MPESGDSTPIKRESRTEIYKKNPRCAAALAALGLIGAIATGTIRLPAGSGQLLVVSGVLLGMYFAQRQFGDEDVNLAVFGTTALVGTVLSLQMLGGNVVETFLEKLGPVLPLRTIGVVALGW